MNRLHPQGRTVISILVWLLSISLLFTLALVPSQAQPTADQLPPSTENPSVEAVALSGEAASSAAPLANTQTILLPTVMHGYRSRPPCTKGSPFMLQIPPSLFELGLDQEDPGQSLTEEQWEAMMFPALMQALEDSGACWARLGLSWAAVQPDPVPSYDWTRNDSKLAQLAATGVRPLVTVDFVPWWAGPAQEGPIYVHRLDEFTQFLTDLVNRYKVPPYEVHTWELFNEPDGIHATTPETGWGRYGDRYAKMLAVAYPAIKSADPSATVVMGGIAWDWFTEYGGPFNRYFSDEVMDSKDATDVAGGNYLDVLNFHYFPDFAAEWERWDPNHEDRKNNWLPAPTCGDMFDGVGTPYEAGGIDVISKASHFRNRMRTCFGVNRPVWLTEFSEHGYPGDANAIDQQARYVFHGYARALAAGVQKASWYSLVAPEGNVQGRGLLYQHDLSPKPAFYAYRTLTYELAGYAYSHTLGVSGVEAYVFRNGLGQEKILAWSTGDPQASGSLTVAPASQLRVVNRQGTATWVQDGGTGDADGTVNGSVRLQLPPVPVDPDPADHMRYTAEPLIFHR